MRYLFACFLIFSSTLFAQQSPPRLIATVDDRPEPIQLSKMDVDVKILGEIAETRATMTFFNPHDRVLEGNLYFPLPEGVTISGYALDVNGVMVDGVAVEKHEARRVYEREERKKIDPGLVEWVKGNNFQTRVYPIPAQGSRTVMVRYLSELSRTSEQTSYYLPLNYAEKIKQFHICMEVLRGASPPVVTKGDLTNFSFSAWRHSYVAETTLENAALNENLLIALPGVEKVPVWVEKSPNGQYHFAINDYEGASFTPQSGTRKIPSRITLYWDTSGSRGNVDHKREITLLEMLFKKWKLLPVTVDLILFSNKAEAARRFAVVNGDATKLLEMLRRTAYDGGTQMAAISPASGGIAPDFSLLFTDGLSNFGKEKPDGFKSPLYIFSADPTSNHPFLSWAALNAQGQYFNLAKMDDKTIVESIGLPVYRFMAARYDRTLIRESYPQTPEPVHGRLILAGRLLAPSAEITLDFGAQGRVLKTAKYVIRQSDAPEGNLLEIFWAQKKVKELSLFPEGNQKDLIVVGKQYGLVNPSTSLIVLERLDQYVQYGIVPPASLPELRKEYLEQMADRREEEKENKEERIEDVLALWNERVKWWKTDFSRIKQEVKKKRAETASESPRPGSGSGVGSGSGGGVGAGSAGETLNNERVQELPLVNRNALNLVKVISGTAVTDETVFGTESKSFAGVSAADVNIQREGIEVNDVRWPAGINDATRVNPDLVGESRMVLAPVNADVGHGNSQIQIVTRSGSAQTVAEDSDEETSIAIRRWDPNTPYLEKLKRATPAEYPEIYLQERETHGSSPAFFLDCADFFFKRKLSALGLRVLSNIAELQMENPAFLRILAHRLNGLGYTRLSVQIFEEVLKMRPEEPQSYRDLALALAEQKKYARAMDLLNHVIMTDWDRFDEIEVIALMEINRIIPLARAQGITAIPLDPRLVRPLDVDVRIVLNWDADMTDVDLWVTEPTGERAYYSYPLTKAGGHVSADFTEGYGPEEYAIHRARTGKYLIQVNYYGSDSQTLQGPVTVHADVYTNYGRKTEKRQRLTLRLGEQKDTFTVGEIAFGISNLESRISNQSLRRFE